MTSFDQPWRPQLDWSAPAGRVLDQLVDALPLIDIDVRADIIAPALAERRLAYGETANGLKARLSGIKPSK